MNENWQLSPLKAFSGRPGPVVLAIMDGVGIGSGGEGDAVANAYTPTLETLKKVGLFTRLQAHGTAVGMPSDDDMGNSEVGHNALGAGRIFAQGARLVSEAIAGGEIFKTETWQWLLEPCLTQGKALHFLGLLSDGNVHSHIDHLFALISAADGAGVRRVNVHALLDGRDVPQTSAHLYFKQLADFLDAINAKGDRCYQIASGGGRMKVTMDRYFADWAVVKRGYDAHVHGIGRPFESALEAIETYRREDPSLVDQNMLEFVVARNGHPVGRVEEGDSLVLFNFRGDRAIEISMALEHATFDKFVRGTHPSIRFAGMMQYDGDLRLPSRFLVSPPAISRTFGEYLAKNGVKSCACSETQKYGHVTYFWNGNRSGYFSQALETYHEIPSDRLPFDERPWMKAAEITDFIVDRILKGEDRFIRLNYANGDMVGHTGNYNATLNAVNAVDLCLTRLKAAVEQAKGILIVTADHGNADEMYMLKKGKVEREKDGTPKPKTAHTLNPVPFIIYDPLHQNEYTLNADLASPGLGNVAATCLKLLGLEPPSDYLPALLTFSE